MSLNISDMLFLGNGILGPNISKNATDMEIKNPTKRMSKANTGLRFNMPKFKNTINISSNDLFLFF